MGVKWEELGCVEVRKGKIDLSKYEMLNDREERSGEGGKGSEMESEMKRLIRRGRGIIDKKEEESGEG